MGMNQLDLFEFDLKGYVVLRNFIPRDTLGELKSTVDRDPEVGDRFKTFMVKKDPIFLNAVSSAEFQNVCAQLVGENYRLDHMFLLQQGKDPKTRETIDIHGGPFEDQGSCSYAWFNNAPRCGLINIGISLDDCFPGDGGLMALAGSHKANMPLTGKALRFLLREGNDAKSFLRKDMFDFPVLKAGDIFVFSEALIHGTSPWLPQDRNRRMLYYCFSPGYMAWAGPGHQQGADTQARNEFQKRLVRAPSVAEYTDAPGCPGIDFRSTTVEEKP